MFWLQASPRPKIALSPRPLHIWLSYQSSKVCRSDPINSTWSTTAWQVKQSSWSGFRRLTGSPGSKLFIPFVQLSWLSNHVSSWQITEVSRSLAYVDATLRTLENDKALEQRSWIPFSSRKSRMVHFICKEKFDDVHVPISMSESSVSLVWVKKHQARKHRSRVCEKCDAQLHFVSYK